MVWNACMCSITPSTVTHSVSLATVLFVRLSQAWAAGAAAAGPATARTPETATAPEAEEARNRCRRDGFDAVMRLPSRCGSAPVRSDSSHPHEGATESQVLTSLRQETR